jgi:hypothetical protein
MWPTEIFLGTPVRTLQRGDVCTNGHRYGRVVSIADTKDGAIYFGPDYEVRVQRLHQKPGGALVVAPRPPSDYRWDGNDIVRRLTQVPCGDPACWRHIRELAEGRYICAAHWSAQLAGIAS